MFKISNFKGVKVGIFRISPTGSAVRRSGNLGLLGKQVTVISGGTLFKHALEKQTRLIFIDNT